MNTTTLPELPLPDTLSELLTLAIKDAEALDRNLYRPSCGVWHWKEVFNVKCAVCLAGAVMAGTLKLPPESQFTAKTFTAKTYRKMLALEDMRKGNMFKAASRIGIDTRWPEETLVQVDRAKSAIKFSRFYDWNDFDVFLTSMKEVRDILQAAGL